MGLATGHLDEAGFVLAGPAPLYAAGLIGVVRGPGRRVAFWLLAGGALFALGDCLVGAEHGDLVGRVPELGQDLIGMPAPA